MRNMSEIPSCVCERNAIWEFHILLRERAFLLIIKSKSSNDNEEK